MFVFFFNFYSVYVFFFLNSLFPGSPGIQSIKEMMDSGWPRSLFVVTNGFSDLRVKEAVVDTGRRGPPGNSASSGLFQNVLGAQWSLSPAIASRGIYSTKQMPSQPTGWGLCRLGIQGLTTGGWQRPVTHRAMSWA